MFLLFTLCKDNRDFCIHSVMRNVQPNTVYKKCLGIPVGLISNYNTRILLIYGTKYIDTIPH